MVSGISRAWPETKLYRDIGKRDRRVHVASVVGYKNVASGWIDVFETLHADARATNEQ